MSRHSRERIKCAEGLNISYTHTHTHTHTRSKGGSGLSIIIWGQSAPDSGGGNDTPVFLPEESHGQRNLEGSSPWGGKESDTAKQLSMHTHACPRHPQIKLSFYFESP